MDASTRIDQVANLCHDCYMTVRSEDFLDPRRPHYMDVRVGFEPSDELNAALQRFLIPDDSLDISVGQARRLRAKHLFRTTVNKVLPVASSDSSGPRFAFPDNVRLNNNREEIKLIADQHISMSRRVHYKRDANGNVLIEMDLLPNEQQRRHLGHYILERWQPHAPLPIFTILPADQLAEMPVQREAAHKFESEFLLSSSSRQSLSPGALPAKQIYVTGADVVMAETTNIPGQHPDIIKDA